MKIAISRNIILKLWKQIENHKADSSHFFISTFIDYNTRYNNISNMRNLG